MGQPCGFQVQGAHAPRHTSTRPLAAGPAAARSAVPNMRTPYGGWAMQVHVASHCPPRKAAEKVVYSPLFSDSAYVPRSIRQSQLYLNLVARTTPP